MTPRLASPKTKAESTLPRRISTGLMGAARILSIIPVDRSTKKLRAV